LVPEALAFGDGHAIFFGRFQLVHYILNLLVALLEVSVVSLTLTASALGTDASLGFSRLVAQSSWPVG